MRIAALLVVVFAGVPGAEAEPPPFDGSRAALEIPDDFWKSVLESGGRAGGVIGYTSDQMRDFGKDTHVLRTVQGLFRDVRKIPRETGRITDGLLDNAMKPSEVIARGYALTDVAAGRMYEPPKDLKWGLKDLEDAATPEAALRKIATKVDGDLAALPEPVQRLLVRLYVACDVGARWLWVAGLPAEKRVVDEVDAAREKLGADAWAELLKMARTAGRDLHAIMRAPWTDEVGNQAATSRSHVFDYISKQGRNEQAYGSILALVHLEQALHEFQEGLAVSSPASAGNLTGARPFKSPIVLKTRWGDIRVYGPGVDTITMEPGTLISLDLGGDDTWSGAVGSSSLGAPVGLHIDLAGNDTYRDEAPAAIACGFLGLGVVVDLAGDDVYDAKQSGLGCGLFGTGLLWDLAGNDSYRSRGPWGQGCGHVGVGALIDLEGDDEYDCVEQAQGLGGTLGAGLLVDVKGNDTYLARDDGNVSALYLNQSVAMAQGCGYGRRADIGDGYSLAGGVGILVDGAGDDRYHAQVWSQGCAYWWSLGILEDRGGNDQYRNGKYSAGAAAHFAIGVCVDLAGDDRHNERNTTAKNQYQGHARDGSIGVFVDGDGDDTYDVSNHCAGAADLNSIGLFWDRRGDDLYTFHDQALGAPNGWNDTGAFGVASRYTPFRSFRDDLPAWGLFLDTGGKDVYALDPAPKDFPATPAAEGKSWKTFPGPLVFGLGWDVEAFPPAPARR